MLMYYGSKENVGGKMLDEIIMQMKSHGRIETYRMISMLINSLR